MLYHLVLFSREKFIYRASTKILIFHMIGDLKPVRMAGHIIKLGYTGFKSSLFPLQLVAQLENIGCVTDQSLWKEISTK
jgi:hypothetical protein